MRLREIQLTTPNNMSIKSHGYFLNEHLLVYAIIAISTIPFFKSTYGNVLLVSCIVLSYKYIIQTIKTESIIFLIVIFLIEIFHILYFKNYEVWVIRQVITFFFSSFFAIYYLKLKFLYIYIKVMYWITIISFFFFLCLIVSPESIKIISNSIPSIFNNSKDIYGTTYTSSNPIVYNFDYNFYKIRNNGPFWEPTVFGSLLLIGQIFNFLITKKTLNKNGIIFTVGIITTFSTTVFIAYFIFIFSHFFLSKNIKIAYNFFLLIITLIGGIYLFVNLQFLETKINQELLDVDNNIEMRGGDSRMASAFLDIKEVSSENIYLLLGKGSSKQSRFGKTGNNILRNCGITELVVQWGVPFSIFYISLIFYSFHQLCIYYRVNKLYSVCFTLIILLLCISEVFFELPVFHCLIIIGLMLKRYYSKRSLKFT